MKVVVLGTGFIGSMVVKELAKHPAIDSLDAVDGVADAVNACVAKADNAKVQCKVTDLAAPGVLEGLLAGADFGVAALPHSLSLPAIQAAIASKCNLLDMVGSRFPEKKALDGAAKGAGVLIVPGTGVAPGLVNVLAARGVELLDEADLAVVLCGGIPRHPLPPLGYQIVFSLESVMGLYTRPGVAIEGGKVVPLPPLSNLEPCTFPDPIGDCETVITDAHGMAYVLEGKVDRLYEKTVRYKGHWGKMQTLAALGYLNEEPIDVDGVMVSPRRFSMALLEPQLKGASEEDITALRVTVTGRKDGRPAGNEWEMVDLYDKERGLTSMAKTTGFPTVVMGEMLAEGRLPERGVLAPEELLVGDRFEPFLAALKGKGIEISHRAW